jgi:hypothetical protein
VSHHKERKEKKCLNCNARVYNKYCGVCGQENIEPQESVFGLVRHFFEDITHFDGKFFTSLKYLITKPGYLTKEYVAGRRMSYLNPVRFYIFTSFLFFLIVFSFLGGSNKIVKEGKQKPNTTIADTTINNASAEDTSLFNITIGSNNNKAQRPSKSIFSKGVLSELVKYIINSKNNSEGDFAAVEYRDRKQFDSLDNLKKVDISFIRRLFVNKVLDQREKYAGNTDAMAEEFVDNVIHLVPQILLLSLPFFALVLKLLYIRRKKFYYVGHIIFSIHFYIFVYIQVLLIDLVSKLAEITNIGLIYDVTVFLWLGVFYYIYRAMRNYYEQGRGKTILKLLILSFFFLLLFTFFLVFLVGLSFYKT